MRTIVHLVEDWSDGRVPEALRLPSRLGVRGRIATAAALLVALLVGVVAVVELWAGETPGRWFDVLFTVVIAGLVSAPWLGLVGSIRGAQEDRAAQARWQATRAAARPARAVVVRRHVNLSEDGTVSTVALVVSLPDGAQVEGEWRPANSRQVLLQTQVPGLGSTVRVWRAPGAAPDAEEVAVIEALDAAVVGPAPPALPQPRGTG
ncbi:hypothetical protein GCM10022237_48780 [Nocardioides ginsengisoli]|uniref:Uncharacterized protein n=1 Tax=Nocardioides ginsengisoli TaxID=363868 RepID=A0ABW3W233_9ACTN